MTYIFKNKEGHILCYNTEGDFSDNNCILIKEEKLSPMSNNYKLFFKNSEKDAISFSEQTGYEYCKIDCEPNFNSLKAYFYVQNLERIALETEGVSLKESFERFIKEQNEGKFLFSDLKSILDSMSESELNSPVLIEVSGGMGEEYHPIHFVQQKNNYILSSERTCFKLKDGKLIFRE